MSTQNPSEKILIIGLDGATFDVLNPMIDAGLLPVLKQLKSNSSFGALLSTTPPTTPPAWASSITGLNPGRHGIFDFTVSPLQNPDRPLISTEMIDGIKLWDVFGRAGKSSIIINLPIIYPPIPIKGIMISGMMTPSHDSEYTYPPDIKHRLKAVCGNYILNVDIARYDVRREKDALQFLDDIRESFDRRFEAVRHIMSSDPWDVMMAVFIVMDRIQHLFIKYMIPGSHLFDEPVGRIVRDRIIREYAHIDACMGELIERAGDSASVFVISDHGFGPTEAYFNVNTWLEECGWLKLHPKQKFKKQLFQNAADWSDGSFLRKILPDNWHANIRKKVRMSRSSLLSPRSDLQEAVDWNSSQAFFASIPSQGIFINESLFSKNGKCDSERVHELALTIKNKLYSLKDPQNGGPLVDSVWFRDEIFHGPYTSNAPHVVFKMKNYAVLGRQHLGSKGLFLSCHEKPIGFHRDYGIFLAAGKKIAPKELKGIEIKDVMPTVVAAAGLAVPEKLDGRVLREIFNSNADTEAIRYLDYERKNVDPDMDRKSSYSESERLIVTERLRQLGYFE